MTNEKDKDIARGIIYQINKERRGHLMGDCVFCDEWRKFEMGSFPSSN